MTKRREDPIPEELSAPWRPTIAVYTLVNRPAGGIATEEERQKAMAFALELEFEYGEQLGRKLLDLIAAERLNEIDVVFREEDSLEAALQRLKHRIKQEGLIDIRAIRRQIREEIDELETDLQILESKDMLWSTEGIKCKWERVLLNNELMALEIERGKKK